MIIGLLQLLGGYTLFFIAVGVLPGERRANFKELGMFHNCLEKLLLIFTIVKSLI